MPFDDEDEPAGTIPDTALMQAVAAGSEEAFAALIRRYQDALLNFFIRMGAYHDGEDLVQETFLRIFRHRAKYRPAASFRTFLYVVARHVWADHGRKAARRQKLRDRLLSDAEIRRCMQPESSPACAIDVASALTRLSPKLKEVLVLNIYQGLRYREVAVVLGVPTGTVKSRMHLALQAMRRLLNEP